MPKGVCVCVCVCVCERWTAKVRNSVYSQGKNEMWLEGALNSSSSSKFISSLIYLSWLHWVFIAACILSLGAMCRGLSSCSVWTFCNGFACCRAQALGSWASADRACGLWSLGSVVVGMGLVLWHVGSSRPGIKSLALHWQADSHPLAHQRSPDFISEHGQGTG